MKYPGLYAFGLLTLFIGSFCIGGLAYFDVPLAYSILCWGGCFFGGRICGFVHGATHEHHTTKEPG